MKAERQEKMEKGTFGYIDAYKKRYSLFSLLLAAVIIAAAIAVYLIFGTVKHVAILIPVILSLPFAKILILWIVVVKFHSMKKEEQEEIEKQLEGRSNCIILYDVALSSYEAISFTPCMVIDQGNVYLLWGGSNDKKYDADKQKEYVQGIIEKTGYDYYASTVNSVQELVDTVVSAPILEEDLSIKCDRLKQRMLDVCV